MTASSDAAHLHELLANLHPDQTIIVLLLDDSTANITQPDQC